jgi:hypothetical protein
VKKRTIQLNLRFLEPDDESAAAVLIEGNQEALEWFARLIIDHAQGNQGCSRQIFPSGPGSAWFTPTATIGLYIHRLPCDHPTDVSEFQAGRKNAS